MTILDSQRGRVVDVNGGTMVRLIALGVLGLALIIALFNSVTRVGTGHVGVLTLFGRSRANRWQRGCMQLIR